MPVSVCPHCKTQLWVKDNQLNVAQGYVVCSKCEGLFQAKHHTREMPKNVKPGQLPNAITDVKLVHSLGPQVRKQKTMSKHEIADLLDNMLPAAVKQEAANQTAATHKNAKEGFNWTMASMVALTVLIMQLFYLFLLR